MDPRQALDAASVAQRGLATRAQLAAAGLGRMPLQRAVASGELVRVARGVYGRRGLDPHAPHLLTDGVPDPAFLRHAQAVLLSLGPDAALRGRCAAVVWGLDMLLEPDETEVQVARSQSHVSLSGVAVRRTSYDVRVVRGLRVTSPLHTLQDCARTRPVAEAVALVDSALRVRLVAFAELPRRGALGRAVALADPRCESVLESALRVLLARHGLPAPLTQYVVRSNGRSVARVDFCWPRHRLIVEADGRRWHDPADARSVDRRRSNACAGLGWRVLRFTWADVLHDPDYVVATVRSALRRRWAA